VKQKKESIANSKETLTAHLVKLAKQAYDMHNALRIYLVVAESSMILEDYKEAIRYC
jgi:hypothetical protein